MAIGPLMTINDLDMMPDDGNRYELIERELLVTHAPGITHQRVSMNLTATLLQYFEQHPIGEVLATPGIVFDVYNAVIPALVVLLHDRREQITAGERFIGAPNIVIRDRVAGYGKHAARSDHEAPSVRQVRRGRILGR